MYREKQLERLDVGRLGVDAPVKDASAHDELHELQLSCIRLVCETYSRLQPRPTKTLTFPTHPPFHFLGLRGS
jgi:hypothetical protein